jgi:hypothetical protein
MSRPRQAISLLLLATVYPLAARGAVCTFSPGASVWSAVDAIAGAGASCSDGGSADASDSFVIPDGASVDVTGDLEWEPATSSRSITVESGASLSVQVSASSGPIVLSIDAPGGAPGIRCESGSSCTFRGGYRQFGVPAPAIQSSVQAAGFFEVGDVLPCPGWKDAEDRWLSDCAGALSGAGDRAGSPDEVGFLYPHPAYAADEPALDAVEAGDLLCFYDPEPGTPDAPVDEGYCYSIVLADGAWDAAAAPMGVLVIDVRQTDPLRPHDSGFPLTLRRVHQGRLHRDVESSSRYVEVDASFIACPDTTRDGCRDTEPWNYPSLVPGDGVADRQDVGRWIRFEEQGAPSQRSYRISRTFDDYADDSVLGVPNCSGGSGTCDVIEIYDPRGFESTQDASDPDQDEFWIDYGHAPGDSFVVLAPVVIRDADPVEANRKIGLFLEGSGHVLQSLLLTDLGALLSRGESDGLARDVVFRDVRSGPGGYQWELDDVQEMTLQRVSFTGGGEDTPRDDAHVITVHGDSTTELVLRTVAIRHQGDDVLSGPGRYAVDAERLRVQWISDEAQSAQIFGYGGFQRPTGRLVDAEFVDCVSNDLGPNSGTVQGGLLERSGILKWGTPGSLVQSPEPDALLVTDYLSVGGEGVLPARVDGFVVAVANHDGNGSGGISGLLDPEINFDVRNGIVRDFTRDRNVFAAAPADGVVENLAFIDVGPAPASTTDCSATDCNLLRVVNNSATFVDFRGSRISMVVRPGASSQLDGAVAANLDVNDYSLDGLLVYGLSRSSQSGIAVNDTGAQARHFFQENTGDTSDGAELQQGPCIADVKAAVTPGHEDELPSAAVLGGDPGFVDPAGDRWDPVSGGLADLHGCGIEGGLSGPGVRHFRWMHAVSRVAPEYLGDPPRACDNGLDDDGDGLADYPADPGCGSSLDFSEHSSNPHCGITSGAGLILAFPFLRRRRARATAPTG